MLLLLPVVLYLLLFISTILCRTGYSPQNILQSAGITEETSRVLEKEVYFQAVFFSFMEENFEKLLPRML